MEAQDTQRALEAWGAAQASAEEAAEKVYRAHMRELEAQKAKIAAQKAALKAAQKAYQAHRAYRRAALREEAR